MARMAPSMAAPPAMSYFISLHFFGRLDGDAAGVEGDAFADQAEHRAFRHSFRLIAQNDEGGRLSGALRDAPERAHLEIVELVGGVDRRVEADFIGHLDGALAKDGGGELVAGLVDQRAGEVLAFADDDALSKCGFAGLAGRSRQGRRG